MPKEPEKTAHAGSLPQTINPPTRKLPNPVFVLPLPDGWSDRSVYCAGGPIQDDVQATITVTIEHRPGRNDVEAFAKEQSSLLEGQLDEFVLHERKKDNLGGRIVPVVEFSWKNADGRLVRQCQWYFAAPPVFLVVTAGAAESAFGPMETSLRAIVRGIVPRAS